MTEEKEINTLLPCWCREDTTYLRIKPHMDHGEFGCRERARYVYCPNCWACGPAYATDAKAIEGWNRSRRAAVAGPRGDVTPDRVTQEHMARLGCGLMLLGRDKEAPIDDPVSFPDRVEFKFEGRQYAIIPAATASPAPAETQTCVKCGHANFNRVQGECDEPDSENIFCGCKCEFTPPETTRVEGEPHQFVGESNSVPCSKCGLIYSASIHHTATSDSARRAAEEIVDNLIAGPYVKSGRVKKVAEIISKHFAAAPADNDAESGCTCNDLTEVQRAQGDHYDDCPRAKGDH